MSKLITWIHAVWTPVNIVLLFIISFSFRHGSIQNKFDSFLARSTTLLSVFDRKFWTKRTLSFLKTNICIYVVNCFIKCPLFIQHRNIMQTKCITNFCFFTIFWCKRISWFIEYMFEQIDYLNPGIFKTMLPQCPRSSLRKKNRRAHKMSTKVDVLVRLISSTTRDILTISYCIISWKCTVC